MQTIVGDPVGGRVEQAGVEQAERDRVARAQLRRGAGAGADEALEQLEGGAVKERAVGIGQRRGRAFEGTERSRSVAVVTDDQAGAGDLALAFGLVEHESDSVLVALATKPTRLIADQPAFDPNVAQADQALVGAGRLGEQIDHRHHRQRGHGPGRAVVVQPGVAGRVELGRAAIGGAAFDDPHADARGLVDPLAVDPERGRGAREGATLVAAALGDLQGRGDLVVLGHDLAAVLPGHRVAERDRFEARGGHAGIHAELEHRPLQELDHRLDPERAGLDGVLEEVGGEEPLARLDVLLGPRATEARGPGLGLEEGDAIEHEQHRPSHAGAPAGGLGAVERPGSLARGVEVSALLGAGREAGLVFEGRGREEPEHGVHRVDQLLAEPTLDVEADDDHRGRLRELGVLDLGAQRAGLGRELGVERAGAVEVAEHQRLTRRERAAHVAGQPPARLQGGLEQDRVGHGPVAVLGEVPGVGRDVVFDLDAHAGPQLADLALDPERAGDEVIGRVRQASDRLGAVEAGVDRAEGLGRAAVGAGQHRAIVEGELAGARDRAGLAVALEQLVAFVERPGGDEAQADAAGVEGLESVDGAEQVGVEGRDRAGDDLFDEDLVAERLGLGRDLAAAAEHEGLAFDRFEAPAVVTDRVAEPGQEEGHRLQAALEHQGAGHAGVVVEVTREEPMIGGDRGAGREIAAIPGAAADLESIDLIEEEHAPSGDSRGPGVRLGHHPGLAKAVPGPTFGECDDLLGAEGIVRGPGRGRIEAGILDDRLIFGAPDAAVGIGQFGVGEEARLALADREAQLAGNVAIVVKEHQTSPALLGVTVEVNVVTQGLADRREPAVVGQRAAEQPIDSLAAVLGVDAEVADEHEVGLARLDHDPRGHAAGVQVPRVRVDVGLGPDRAELERERLGVEAGDAIGEQQRRLGHADLTGEAVLAGEGGAEDAGDRSVGVDLERGAIEGRADRAARAFG